MHPSRRMTMVASTLLGLTIIPGCEDSKPSTSSSTTEATVKGSVLIDGKPVTSGDILFDASNYQRQMPARSAPISKDGTYEIKTYLGENTIKLGGAAARRSPIVQNMKRSLDVKAGENTFNFEGSAK